MQIEQLGFIKYNEHDYVIILLEKTAAPVDVQTISIKICR